MKKLGILSLGHITQPYKQTNKQIKKISPITFKFDQFFL